MDKQKLLRAIEAAMQALEAFERAIKDYHEPKISTEPWTPAGIF